LISDVIKQSKQFFALPLDEKLALDLRKSSCKRGYDPIGGQTLEADAPPDLKESFYVGVEGATDDAAGPGAAFGPNQWPDSLPSFRAPMETYHAAMYALSADVMRAIALSLDVEENYFDRFCDGALANLRLLHYPPQPANPRPGEKGCGAHTDFGGITLLHQDSPGLQVFMGEPADGGAGWVDATPMPGAFLVNLGDMIARWTNNRYRSTLHRVINLTGTARYSLAFFYSGNPECQVECIPTCLAAGETPRFPAITVAAHMSERYRTTYHL
jgi:isopenicillin N synthase-like dioxygenase